MEHGVTELALLQNLLSGTGSVGQLIGGLIVAVLYLVIGLLAAMGSIFVFRRVFRGRWEQMFWASFLIAIAAFYLGFAAYFAASTPAWQIEEIGVAVFLACGVAGLYSRSLLAAGYLLHGIWDVTHSLSGTSLAGYSLTEIPLGYDMFCLTYDITVACYLFRNSHSWHEPGKFNPMFWRENH